MQILKEAGIDWHERRLIGKSCMNQEYESTTGPVRDKKVWRWGRGVRQGCCLSLNLFSLHSVYFTKEAVEGLADFRIWGQAICAAKYADGLVLLAKEKMMLQGMIGRLIEIGRWYGIEVNVEETKVMGISREPFPVQIMIDQRQLASVEYLNHLGSMIANDARYTHEIKSRIAMA